MPITFSRRLRAVRRAALARQRLQAFLGLCALLSLGAVGGQPGSADAAISEKIGAATRPSYSDASEPPAQPATPADAATTISGSRWPGVIDHLLQRPAPGSPPTPGKVGIHLNYPSIGDRRVDTDIRQWATDIANAFESHFELSVQTPLPDPDAGLSEALNGDPLLDNLAADAPGLDESFELWGDYKISRPSPASVSITFELWNYANGGQGNLDIITLNYSLLTGQRLALVDIFEKPDQALELMSSWSRKKLASRLGATRRTRMIEEGTAPLAENFSSLTLTPEGLRINFQPFQVAPWEAGIQKVDMPLSELMESAPLLALWGK